MSWNYRIVYRHLRGEDIFAIYEVFYDDDGKPTAISDQPVWPQGDTVEELLSDCRAYQAALGKCILKYEDFEVGRIGAAHRTARNDAKPIK